MVAKHIGLDFLGVIDREHGATCGDAALVADLAATLCVKRCGVEHDHTALPGVQHRHGHAIGVQRHHFGGFFQQLVAGKGIAFTAVFQCTIHLELAGSTGLSPLAVHRSAKADLVHRQATFTAHVGRQV